jgi:hypothetical protein
VTEADNLVDANEVTLKVPIRSATDANAKSLSMHVGFLRVKRVPECGAELYVVC